MAPNPAVTNAFGNRQHVRPTPEAKAHGVHRRIAGTAPGRGQAVPATPERANAYFGAAVVPAFQEYLREQGEEASKDEAFDLLKMALLPTRKIVNPTTGELIGELPAHTHTMDSGQYSDFTERSIAFHPPRWSESEEGKARAR